MDSTQPASASSSIPRLVRGALCAALSSLFAVGCAPASAGGVAPSHDSAASSCSGAACVSSGASGHPATGVSGRGAAGSGPLVALPTAGTAASVTPPITGTLPTTPSTGTTPAAGGMTTPPPPVGAAGRGSSMMMPPTGMTAAAGGSASGSAGAGAGTGVPADQLEMLRQTCVDEINMYRATLTSAMLKPLKRASAAQEMCSDQGAQMDGDSMQAHGSAKAGLCTKVGLYSEDTCPGWGVGGFSGNATIADALKSCLKSMWAEGEPPGGRAMCTGDCFQKYGHYLNMSDPNVGSVACSFYKMTSGMYWMNQDFAR